MKTKEKYITPTIELYFQTDSLMKSKWSVTQGDGPVEGSSDDNFGKEGGLRYDDVFNSDDPNPSKNYTPWED